MALDNSGPESVPKQWPLEAVLALAAVGVVAGVFTVTVGVPWIADYVSGQ